MPLQKQTFNLNFAQGLETKLDPLQLPFGKFLKLTNTIFDTGLMLRKRNGYGALTALPDATSTLLTTFNNNLTAIGTSLNAYSAGASSWVNKGQLQPIQLSTLPLIRSNTNQTQCDSVVSSNGLVCTVFTDNTPSATYKYVIADSTTGQNIVAPTVIPVASGTVTGSPRVFFLANYFVIVFTNVITATNHLQYVAISTTNLAVTSNTDISTTYTPATTLAFDGIVANNNLYLAWNGSDGGGAIRMTYLNQTLTQHNTVTFVGRACTMMSVCADFTQSTPVIWATFYNSADTTLYALAVNQALTTILAPTLIENTLTLKNIASSARGQQLVAFYEVANTYSYDNAISTNYVGRNTVTQAGSVGSGGIFYRGVGLASKAFLAGSSNNIYVLLVYSSSYQPTYFLGDFSGHLVAKLAYQNGGGYLTLGLPSVTVNGSTAQVAYLYKDLIQAVNKNTNVASGTQTAGIYSQTGVNLVTFNFSPGAAITSEIGNNLHLSGGFLWMYDGYKPVEHNFFLYPDNVEVTTSASGGSIAASTYYYQATYEWSDNQGNIFRSAPSIPVSITTTGSTSTNTINVPTLRLTYKTANPVKIVVYRWSLSQQSYYQITSIASPKLNDPTADYLAITDTLADATILGNNLLYTTGGVVEDIGAPAASSMTLFKSRLMLLNAEDGSIWYSKQVLQATPVEMSDLFTLYLAPTIGAQGSTGLAKCLSAMDDKFIVFKENAIYYMTGTGPDNTGANNDFSDFVFITSTVGSANQQSIVFIPNGLMFQSDKGIWLLGRDLSTNYIGSPVEKYTLNATVQSAVNIPGTNQVRFTLSSGITLLYDYFYGQWGTFENVPAISSTLYGNLHTYLNSFGQVFQETPGVYLDGSKPVLIGLTTSWINLAGLQGYQRAYEFYLQGTYYSPHQLQIQVGYDYNSSPTQTSMLTPDNYSTPYGGDAYYGASSDSSTYGGNSQSEAWRIFFNRQKCEAFQITLQEIYDPSFGVTAGQGLSLSGLDLVVGMKKGYPLRSAARSIG